MPSVEGCPGILCPYDIPLEGLAYDWTGWAMPHPAPSYPQLSYCRGWEGVKRGEPAAVGCSPA
eukprot:6161923-Pleurochrysis_carterae.AAC.1